MTGCLVPTSLISPDKYYVDVLAVTGGGGGGTAVVFVLCVISPDHWLIVLLILSEYWPAAPTRGWC